MSNYFNKYKYKDGAYFSSIDLLKNSENCFISGIKSNAGLIGEHDKDGNVVWEKEVRVALKHFTIIDQLVDSLDNFVFLILQSLPSGTISETSILKVDSNGKLLEFKEIKPSEVTYGSKIIELARGEYLISHLSSSKNKIFIQRISSSLDSIETKELSLSGVLDHNGLASLKEDILMVGNFTNKEGDDGLLIFNNIKNNISVAFTLMAESKNKSIKIGDVIVISSNEFIIAGSHDNDVFWTKGKYSGGTLQLEPIRPAFLFLPCEVKKVVKSSSNLFVLAFDKSAKRDLVIKYNTTSLNYFESIIWAKYITLEGNVSINDIAANGENLMLCGFTKSESGVNPFVIRTDFELTTCNVNIIQKIIKEPAVSSLIFKRTEIKSVLKDFQCIKKDISQNPIKATIEEICKTEDEIKSCPFAFNIWNTLEPRTRNNQYEKALRAEVNDAMWMLTRQWQWGEFEGEDGGSLVYSKLGVKETKLNKYAPNIKNNTLFEKYDENCPLESQVERLPINIENDWLIRIESGKYFLKLIKISGISENDYINLKGILIDNFKLRIPTTPIESEFDTREDYVNELIKFKTLISNADTWQLMTALNEKAVDGKLLIESILENTLVSLLSGFSDIPEIIDKFKIKYLEKFGISNYPSAWSSKHLEYKFESSSPKNTSNGDNLILYSDGYNGKEMDWYQCDIKYESSSIDDNFVTYDENEKNNKPVLIPSKIFFPGMPESRWWQMEDNELDFGNMIFNKTDVSKLLLLDFMLNYAGNWSMIPLKVDVGSLIEIQGIEVKDCFGIRTLIEPSNKTNHSLQSGQRKWSLFQLFDSNENSLPDSLLFLSPTISYDLKSSPIEKVNFVRDEMANMVWGIEQTINSGLNKGVDGFEINNSVKNLLIKEVPLNPDTEQSSIPSYKLINEVSENWIPFIPFNIQDSNRSIQLQRANILRSIPEFEYPIEPKTQILNDQDTTYYIAEEEVPKAGRIVESRWQRTRWFNGKTVIWYGNEKKVGRGGGRSGLMFDQLGYDKK